MQKIFFEGEARSRLLGGAKILRRAVGTTMTPLGRNVIIKKPFGITTTHDGVTVAESIIVSDAELAAGADIIKEAAGKINNEVGDGTTSVTILTYALMELADGIINSELNAMNVRTEMIKIQAFLQKTLEQLTIELTDDKLVDVATVSVGDKELGKIIGELAIELGKHGTIVVEQGKGYKTEPEVKQGFTFERTYISPYMITDKKKQAAVLENPHVVITSEKLKTYSQVQALIDQAEGAKSVLFICEELSGEALATVVQGLKQLPMAAVIAPAFGDARRQILEDIAVYTGGEVYTDNQSGSIGKATKVSITRDMTTIVGGQGQEPEVLGRVDEIKGQIENAEGDYEKEQLEARIANLLGKVGIIKVGGATESEVDEKKYRVDDAVAAVKAAQLGGIVAGGAVTYYNLATELENSHLEVDPRVKSMVAAALKEPMVQLCINANLDYGIISGHLNDTIGKGFNVLAPNRLIDMVQEGIIDPSRVTEKVIEAAFSVAMTAITTDVLVVDLPDEV